MTDELTIKDFAVQAYRKSVSSVFEDLAFDCIRDNGVEDATPQQIIEDIIQILEEEIDDLYLFINTCAKDLFKAYRPNMTFRRKGVIDEESP